nr:DUF6350 family protein [Corynebacterium mendelii]
MESGFVTLPATVGQLWLAANLAPVGTSRITLSALPMLPAVLVIALVARQVHKVIRVRAAIADVVLLVVLVPLVPLLLTGVALFMVWDASPVFPVTVASVPGAVASTALVHGTGLVLGMGPRLWKALCTRAGVPVHLVSAATVAADFLRYLAVAATAVFAVSLLWHIPQLVELSERFNGPWAVVGLVLLSILYLPNAVVATAAVLLGSGVGIGGAEVSLFDVVLVPLPPLPLLAALPAEAPVWFQLLLLIPAVCAGAAVFKHLRATQGDVSGLYVSGVFAGLFALVAVTMSRGVLGVYGTAGPLLWLSAGLALVWMAAVSWTVIGVGRAAWALHRRNNPDEAADLAEPAPEEAAHRQATEEDAVIADDDGDGESAGTDGDDGSAGTDGDDESANAEGDDQSVTTDADVSAGGESAGPSGGDPAGTDEEPAGTDEEPAGTDEEPAGSDHMPADGEPANGEPAGDGGDPAGGAGNAAAERTEDTGAADGDGNPADSPATATDSDSVTTVPDNADSADDHRTADPADGNTRPEAESHPATGTAAAHTDGDSAAPEGTTREYPGKPRG